MQSSFSFEGRPASAQSTGTREQTPLSPDAESTTSFGAPVQSRRPQEQTPLSPGAESTTSFGAPVQSRQSQEQTPLSPGAESTTSFEAFDCDQLAYIGRRESSASQQRSAAERSSLQSFVAFGVYPGRTPVSLAGDGDMGGEKEECEYVI